jgi:hypothetical protein
MMGGRDSKLDGGYIRWRSVGLACRYNHSEVVHKRKLKNLLKAFEERGCLNALE